MVKIGITGGIGSGKSTVCKVFGTLGIPIFYADEQAKSILDNNATVKEAVKNGFGEGVFDENGLVDRSKMAELVFQDEAQLERLNSIIHPAVDRQFLNWIEAQKAPYVLKEAAIIFESGTQGNLDGVILVVAPEALRIERVMKRDGVTEAQVKQRMKRQWGDAEKRKLADYLITNDDQSLVVPQVLALHQKIMQRFQLKGNQCS